MKRIPKTTRVSDHMTGKTNVPVDVQRIAMQPGMRVSKMNKEYFEGRMNRSDKSKLKRL